MKPTANPPVNTKKPSFGRRIVLIICYTMFFGGFACGAVLMLVGLVYEPAMESKEAAVMVGIVGFVLTAVVSNTGGSTNREWLEGANP